jgi:DNA polymerase IV (DinB-like DNA polymerase)
LKYFVGCSGWRFELFYPPALDPKERLSYYSRVFDLTEVGLPATYRFSLGRWARETPEGFRFTVRIPRQALDDGTLGTFLVGLAPVEEKILAVVVQTPAGVPLAEGKEWLERVLGACTYHGYSAAVEFAHPSWFQDMGYGILKRHGAALCWDAGRRGEPQAAVTADFLYLRLGRANGWKAWVQKAREEVEQDRRIDTVIIVADRPAGANAALRALDMPEKKYSGPLPAPAPLLSAGRWPGRVVICVDLNAFYPSCEELREPSLRGRPHAVIMTDQPAGTITKGVVSSCSYEARRFGVKSAMPLARALALCPEVILRPVDMEYYKHVSEKVMEVIAGFADVLEQASIDEAFLDCTTRAGPSPHEHAVKIKRAIKERCGLAASVGVAPSKSAAKIASDFKKPDGLTVVHPDNLRDFIAPLEVGRISGIGPKTQQELKRLGIETIGQLAACDVQKLSARFGRNGLWMWKVANGEDDEPVLPREDHASISTEHSLDLHARGRNEVLAHLNSLVDHMYERVAAHGYLFRTVGVRVVRSDFTAETRELSFQTPQARKESIALAIPQLVDRLVLDSPVRKVGIRVANLVPAARQEAQRTLLDYAGV